MPFSPEDTAYNQISFFRIYNVKSLFTVSNQNSKGRFAMWGMCIKLSAQIDQIGKHSLITWRHFVNARGDASVEDCRMEGQLEVKKTVETSQWPVGNDARIALSCVLSCSARTLAFCPRIIFNAPKPPLAISSTRSLVAPHTHRSSGARREPRPMRRSAAANIIMGTAIAPCN